MICSILIAGEGLVDVTAQQKVAQLCTMYVICIETQRPPDQACSFFLVALLYYRRTPFESRTVHTPEIRNSLIILPSRYLPRYLRSIGREVLLFPGLSYPELCTVDVGPRSPDKTRLQPR